MSFQPPHAQVGWRGGRDAHVSTWCSTAPARVRGDGSRDGFAGRKLSKVLLGVVVAALVAVAGACVDPADTEVAVASFAATPVTMGSGDQQASAVASTVLASRPDVSGGCRGVWAQSFGLGSDLTLALSQCTAEEWIALRDDSTATLQQSGDRAPAIYELHDICGAEEYADYPACDDRPLPPSTTAADDEPAFPDDIDIPAEYHQALIADLASDLEAGGATREEARCVASALFEDLGELTEAGRSGSAPDMEVFEPCGTATRVAEILAGKVTAALSLAGATQEEAACINSSVTNMDLLLPSKANGEISIELLVSRFENEAARCASAERLHSIAVALSSG